MTIAELVRDGWKHLKTTADTIVFAKADAFALVSRKTHRVYDVSWKGMERKEA